MIQPVLIVSNRCGCERLSIARRRRISSWRQGPDARSDPIFRPIRPDPGFARLLRGIRINGGEPAKRPLATPEVAWRGFKDRVRTSRVPAPGPADIPVKREVKYVYVYVDVASRPAGRLEQPEDIPRRAPISGRGRNIWCLSANVRRSGALARITSD